MKTKMRYGAGRQAAAGMTTPTELGAPDLYADAALISGQDLDTFMTPGTWYCASSTVAAALSNAPTAGSGFKLIVMQNTPNRLTQIAFQNAAAARIYVRFYNGTAWQAWHTITPA